MFELGTRSFATAVVAILAMNTSVSADGPAVSDVNTKLSIFGGSAGDPDGIRAVWVGWPVA